jgi:hypothetical protein
LLGIEQEREDRDIYIDRIVMSFTTWLTVR